MKKCHECGKELYDFAQRCDGCGIRLIKDDTQIEPKPVEVKPERKLENIEPGMSRNQFFDALKRVCRPINEEDKIKMGNRLPYALDLLKKDAIKAFWDDIERAKSRYNEDTLSGDIYFEVLVERNNLDNMAKMLRHWSKYLEALPDGGGNRRGAVSALQTLASLCDEIDNICPEDYKK